MNKSQLIDKIAADAGLSKKDAEAALKATLGAIEGALVKNDKVVLVGFGTFKTKKLAARSGRNPATGAALKIPASTVPTFKAGKSLKDKVNARRARRSNSYVHLISRGSVQRSLFYVSPEDLLIPYVFRSWSVCTSLLPCSSCS